MIGAEIYAYRMNFSCKENKYKNPYLKSIKLKLVDLFRPYHKNKGDYTTQPCHPLPYDNC
jgi:hypothetical protein